MYEILNRKHTSSIVFSIRGQTLIKHQNAIASLKQFFGVYIYIVYVSYLPATLHQVLVKKCNKKTPLLTNTIMAKSV